MAFGSSLFSIDSAVLAQKKKPRIANRTQYVSSLIRDVALTQRDFLRRPIAVLPTRPGINIPRRAGVNIPTRPGINIPRRPTIIQPGININGGIIPTVAAAGGVMPRRAGTAAAPGGGLPALSGGGFDLGLGAIGGQIGSSVTGVIGQVKNLIPLAVKIIIAVVVVKIVLWLVRGRRR